MFVAVHRLPYPRTPGNRALAIITEEARCDGASTLLSFQQRMKSLAAKFAVHQTSISSVTILNTRNALFVNIRTQGERDKNTLALWERKIPRKTFGLVKHNDVRSVHNNQELIDLYTEPDITSEIAKGRLRRLEHMKRMPEERTVKESKNIPDRRRSAGKPRKRCLDNVQNDLKKMGIRG